MRIYWPPVYSGAIRSLRPRGMNPSAIAACSGRDPARSIERSNAMGIPPMDFLRFCDDTLTVGMAKSMKAGKRDDVSCRSAEVVSGSDCGGERTRTTLTGTKSAPTTLGIGINLNEEQRKEGKDPKFQGEDFFVVLASRPFGVFRPAS